MEVAVSDPKVCKCSPSGTHSWAHYKRLNKCVGPNSVMVFCCNNCTQLKLKFIVPTVTDDNKIKVKAYIVYPEGDEVPNVYQENLQKDHDVIAQTIDAAISKYIKRGDVWDKTEYARKLEAKVGAKEENSSDESNA